MTTMKKLAAGAATGALALALMTSAARAQETTGGINGSVHEGSTPVSVATVTVIYTPTNQTFTATTDAGGQFAIRQLPPGGPYRVITKDAAHAERTTDVGSIGVGSAFELDVDYGAGAAAAGTAVSEVVVTASRAGPRQVQTGPRSTFNATDIVSLPSFQRDLRDIARLNPFVQLDPTNNNALIIAGNNNRFNAIYVDGVRESDDFGLNANGYPTQRSPISIDLVQALNVEVAPYDVQYGAFQGGVLNLTTKSGSNEFHGSGFYEYDSRQLGAGEEIRDRPAFVNFKDKTYGFTFSGPIIKDKVFFSFGYENYEGLASPGYGPQDGAGAANLVSGVTTAQVQQVRDILRSVYNYDAGSYGASAPITSEKYFGKLTWQINNQHRFVFEVQNDDDTQFSQFSSTTVLALDSTPYILEQPFESYSGYLYSNWTPNLSTEISYTHRDTANLTNNLGAPFPNFQIYLSGAASGPSIRVGNDVSRQANLLQTTDQLFRAKANYTFGFHGQHTITAGYEREQLDVFNVFVQNAFGNYQFTSIANLQNRLANQITYANAGTNNANDGAAAFTDAIHTVYLQDEWRPLSNLTLRAGVRAEIYEQDDKPRANALFQQLYGFSNTANLGGINVIQPRFGFNYRPFQNLVINGGLGLFSGGSPNVWISNNYSNSGNLLGSVNCPNAVIAACAGALTNVQGLAVNPGLQAANTASAALGTGITNALDPNFEAPSVWKASIGVAYTANFKDWSWTGPVGRILGNDWRLHGDYLYQTAENAVLWRDLQTVNAVIGTAPDGRPIYNPNRSVPATRTNTYDLLLTNTNKGRSEVYALGLGKTFDWGFDFDVTYTHTDSKDVNPATSSVALSNYAQLAFSDPNNPGLATSNYNIKNAVKVSANWEKQIFPNYFTRIRLYATRRSGLPYSYTFTGTNSVQNGVYDIYGLANSVGGTRNNELFFVPRADSSGNVTATSDPRVAYNSTFNVAAFNDFLKASGLIRYAGQITPRNAFTARDVTQADVSFSQEIPGFFPRGAKAELYFNIFNVGNLINNSWGVIDQFPFPNYYVLNIQPTIRSCSAAGVVGCGAGQVSQYLYSPVTSTTGVGRVPTANTSGQPPASLWALKLGVRFKF